MANTDTCLPKGGGKDQQDSLLIRKGQRIILSLIGSHRNPTHFGVDASEFRPSRWDDINVNTPGYVPFSIGPRACTGRE
jgi:cytochrome P450